MDRRAEREIVTRLEKSVLAEGDRALWPCGSTLHAAQEHERLGARAARRSLRQDLVREHSSATDVARSEQRCRRDDPASPSAFAVLARR